MADTWFIVPARGGSKGIPKKNVRLLGGKPLIHHVLHTLQSIAEKSHIIVTTDDDEIISISKPYSTVHLRSADLSGDDVTLDSVINEIVEWLISKKGATPDDKILTLQATSPFISIKTIKSASDILSDTDVDTVLTVKDDRHLRWKIEKGDSPVPLYNKRVNRQWLPSVFAETGGIIGCRIKQVQNHQSRIGTNIKLLEIGEKEGLDIDSYADWATAEYWANKLKIIIRVDGSNSMGFGHLYRGLALAECLTLHEIIFLTRSDGEYKLGSDFLKSHNYPVYTIDDLDEAKNFIKTNKPDLLIHDILDTDKEYIQEFNAENIFTVNFEDLGTGNQSADIVINDLYPDLYPRQNHWYGVEYSILNPQFEHYEGKHDVSKSVNNILIVFGGTDPGNLTLKAVQALSKLRFKKEVTIVVGPGYSHMDELRKYIEESGLPKLNLLQNVKNMAELMSGADLAITSAGRTVTELMVIGVPTIAVCQNMREMRHNHATSTYGVVNLGMGESLEISALTNHIDLFLNNYNLRRDMFLRMKKTISRRSNKNIVSKILEAYQKHSNHY